MLLCLFNINDNNILFFMTFNLNLNANVILLLTSGVCNAAINTILLQVRPLTYD